MARPGVEYETVERVARQLVSKGQHPSVQKVRNVLGTGSNTTIAKHLKAWQSLFDASRSPVLPESVPDDLMTPLDDFWSTAVARAEANYQKFKEELVVKLDAAEANEQLAFNQLAVKTKEFEELKKLQNATNANLRQTEQQFQTLQGKHSALTSELNHAHTQMESAFTLLQEQKHNFDIERENDNHNHQEAIVYERERTTATETRLFKEIDQLRQNLKSNKDKRIEQQNELKAHIDKSRHHEQSFLRERSELQAENQQLNAEEHQRRQETEVLKSQLTTVQRQLTQSIETVEAMRLAFEQSKNNESHLTNSISELKETIAHLHSIKIGKNDEHTK